MQGVLPAPCPAWPSQRATSNPKMGPRGPQLHLRLLLPAKKAARMFYPCVCSPATAPGAVSNSPAAGGLGDVEINLFNSVPAAPRAGIANLLRSSRGSHTGLCALNPHEMSRLSRETREAGAQGTGDWPCRVRAGVLLPWSSRLTVPTREGERGQKKFGMV